jgi:hypothetical protein
MREDMARVVTERPRAGGWRRYRPVREKAIAHRDLDRLADLPRQEGMRLPHIRAGNPKDFTDLLGPLRGFLIQSVGRPWDKVYSEICERISPNSTVQIHILTHVGQFVQTRTLLGDDGMVYYCGKYTTGLRAIDRPGDMYVHPATGLLCRVPERAWRRRRDKPQDNFRKIGPEKELWRENGVWYWAVFGTAELRSMFDQARTLVWSATPTDYFTGKPVPVGARYRCGKRQACGRDLRKYGLENEAAA